MKIVHILEGKANPNTLNGVNKVVYNLATEQTKLGHDVTVFALSNNKEIPFEHNFKIEIFPTRKSLFFLTKKLRESLNSLDVNTVVHLHSVFIPPFVAISKILIKRSIRYIFTPHSQYNPISLSRNRFAKQVYLTLFEKQLLKNAYKLHALGSSEVNDIKALVPNANVYQVPNGLETIDISQLTPAKSSDNFIFVDCCRLEIAQKGLDLLIMAFAALVAGDPRYQKSELWLIGEGPDRVKLEELTQELDVSNKVIFLGKKFNTEKLQLLLNAHCFISPSRWECYPTAVLEAAAIGLPIIISDRTDIGDLISKYSCGITTDISPNAITISMKKMIDDYQVFRNYDNNAVYEDLNWAHLTQEHLKEYSFEHRE